LAFGLRRREAIIRRKAFIKAVGLIKLRLKKVLNRYMMWKAEKQFKALEDLIANFDQEPAGKKKFGKINAKVSYTTSNIFCEGSCSLIP
jgi:hypothetical protein